jgi:hypothetical protein
MNEPDILSIARQHLSDAILKSQPATCDPLNVSPWIAMSALQKAIRRGQDGLAQRAAATLLSTSPERLWRRCGCIAFEDVGVADLDTVAIVTAALAGKRLRASLGGEWRVASYIVSRMVQAPKCRAADDLLMGAELHPAFTEARRELAAMATRELLALMIGAEPLPVRALACWFAIGTDRRPSPRLNYRRGDPYAVFDALNEAGYPHALVETARENFRRTREVLAPFTVLLWPSRQAATPAIVDDEMPPEIMIDGVPGWALDTYTREGRRALKLFLQSNCMSARWINKNVPAGQRLNLLGNIVFRVEGGLVRRRSRWPMSNDLRHMVDVGSHGPACADATEILDLVRADIPVLNRVRAEVMGGTGHAS